MVHAVEFARGRALWTAYRSAAEARGAEFSLDKLLPSTDVPDAENFAAVPVIRAGVKARHGEGPQPTQFDMPKKVPGLIRGASRLDFAAVRKELVSAEWLTGAEAVTDPEACLGGLSRLDPALSEIREGLKRPFARYGRDVEHPEKSDVPPFLLLRSVAQLLRVKFEAHAATGDLEAAAEDFEFSCGLARTLDENPTLVGAMIQAALTILATQSLEAWLHDASWTDPQLARLASALQGKDPFASACRALDFERASFVSYGTRLAAGALDAAEVFRPTSDQNLSEKVWRLCWKVYPRGWHYRSLAWGDPIFVESREQLDLATHHWRPSMGDPDAPFRVTSLGHLRLMYAMIAIPNYQRVVVRTVVTEANLHLARVALALERFRLASGGYPEGLDELESLRGTWTNDPICGEPLSYERDDRGFLLYSLAINGEDDGGSSEKNTVHSMPVDDVFDQLDWVWASSHHAEAAGKAVVQIEVPGSVSGGKQP